MATRAVTLTDIQSTASDNDIVLPDSGSGGAAWCRQFGPVFEKASDEHP